MDCGNFPAKRVAGDTVVVEADIFGDGHDLISAIALHRHSSDRRMTIARMQPLVNDRWRAEFNVKQLGFYLFTIEAWIDHFLTWHRDLRKRVAAAQSDLETQLTIGLEMIRAAARRARARDRRKLDAFAKAIASDDPIEVKLEEIWSSDLLELMWRNGDRSFVTRSPIEVAIEVDRPKAAFSTWYEMFPRSAGAQKLMARCATSRSISLASQRWVSTFCICPPFTRLV